MEDLRRRKKYSSGRVQSICTMCELEGRSNVQAEYEYSLVSTMDERQTLVTTCRDHAGQLDNGKLPYKVVRQKKVGSKVLNGRKLSNKKAGQFKRQIEQLEGKTAENRRVGRHAKLPE